MRAVKRIPRACAILAAAVIGFTVPASVRAADYQIVASGPIVTADIESATFDGTTAGTLPPILNGARLAGGSFRATYRFSTVTPDVGDEAFYDLSPTSGITFELLDASGTIVHAGSESSAPYAILENNVGGAPYTADQVILGAAFNHITGSTFPTALYGPPTDIVSDANFNVFGYVSPGVDYVPDLSIPTDAATYLGFPEKNFVVLIDFEDGDYVNRVNPFQSSSALVTYDIAALTITPVPEPLAGASVVAAATVLVRRRYGR